MPSRAINVIFKVLGHRFYSKRIKMIPLLKHLMVIETHYLLILVKPEKIIIISQFKHVRNQLTEHSPKGILLAFEGIYFQT